MDDDDAQPPGTNPGVLMARQAAMLLATIWQEPSWRALSRDAQWLYMFLLSQPDLNHCGVISLRAGRWSRAAASTTPDQIQQALKDLEAARYVVVDEDTGELLVRALLRRDRVYLQPNLMRSALGTLPAIESPAILRALRAEVERIIAENGDHVRLDRGEAPLSAKQKEPLTRIAVELRAIGAPGDALSSENGGSVNPGRLARADLTHDKGGDLTHDNPLPNEPDPAVSRQNGRSVNPSGDPFRRGFAADRDAADALDVPDPAVSWENVGSVNPSGNPSSENPQGQQARFGPAPALSRQNSGGVNPSGNPLGYRGKGLGSSLEVVTLTTKDQPLKEFPQNRDLEDALIPIEVARPPSRVPGAFDQFWKAYPHKRDKDAARRAWDKITRGKDRVPVPVLIQAARNYAESREVADGFAKYPATFLNKGSWRDFVHGQPPGRPARKAGASRAVEIAAERRARRATGGEITDGRR